MNTKLIKEFKTEFDWWLEDPENRSVGVKVSGEWDSSEDLVHGPFAWPLPELITAIVKNDEYAEFRMAEADGKKVQVNAGPACAPQWRDMKGSAKYGAFEPKCYRVRPSWEWQDDVSKENPVLCRVWDGEYDEDEEKEGVFTNVVDYNEFSSDPYTDIDGEKWGCAEPITISDLHPFQRKGCYSIDELKALGKKYTGMPAMFIEWLEKQ